MRGQIERWKPWSIAGLFFLAIIGFASPVLAKHKDDVVTLKNGDRLTGEIKGLNHGELRFKTSYMVDAVLLDWNWVERVETKDSYIIALTNGTYITGRIELTPAGQPGSENVLIRADNKAVKVKQADLVTMRPTGDSFWKHLDGDIDYGFNFTSGDSSYQSQLSTTVTYRQANHSVTTNLSSVFSGQEKGSSTVRNDFGLEYRNRFSPKWEVGGLFDLLRSDQQSLDLRTTAGAFLGRNFVQTDRTSLWTIAGVVLTNEKYAPSVGLEPRTRNVEAVAGINFTTFRFKKLDVSSKFLTFPSLTQPGRVRLGSNSSLKVELAKRLYWSFSVYENFDSRPPVNAKKNDLGISASLGWKFGSK